MDPWPADKTNRSRLGHWGAAGSWRRAWAKRAVPISAQPRGSPGWPDWAFSTASAASTRTVWAMVVKMDIENRLLPGGRVSQNEPVQHDGGEQQAQVVKIGRASGRERG